MCEDTSDRDGFKIPPVATLRPKLTSITSRRPSHSMHLLSRSQLHRCYKYSVTLNFVNQAAVKFKVLFRNSEVNPDSMCKVAVTKALCPLMCVFCKYRYHIEKICRNVRNQDLIDIKGQGSRYLWNYPACLGLRKQQ